MRPATEEWLKQAEYDLKTAKAMGKAARYVYTVFMCHLAVEKALKGLIVERTGNTPPKIHDLVKLAKLAQVQLNKEQIEFISILNVAAIGTRYPEYLDDVIKKYPKKKALEYLKKAEEIVKWISKDLTLAK